MKFVVYSSELSSRMQTIGRVITTKNSIQILSCFLFEIKGNTLRLLASDSENMLYTSLPLIESDVDGTFAINAKNAVDAIRNIPEQPISIYLNESTMELVIEYQNGKYTLMAEKADEYPIFPEIAAEATAITLPSEYVLRSITRALPATTDDDSRPVMTGIYFDVMPESITIVASDGHKLVSGTLTPEEKLTEEAKSFILPKKPALLMKTLLSKDTEDTTIKFTPQNAVIANANYTLSCRLIEGKYPNYKGAIPTTSSSELVVDRAAILGALSRTLALATSTAALIKVKIDQNEVVLESQNVDYAMAAVESLTCRYDGTPMNIGFKGSVFMELINNLEFETLSFKVIDPTRPCVITADVETGVERSLALIMPMMLND